MWQRGTERDHYYMIGSNLLSERLCLGFVTFTRFIHIYGASYPKPRTTQTGSRRMVTMVTNPHLDHRYISLIDFALYPPEGHCARIQPYTISVREIRECKVRNSWHRRRCINLITNRDCNERIKWDMGMHTPNTYLSTQHTKILSSV